MRANEVLQEKSLIGITRTPLAVFICKRQNSESGPRLHAGLEKDSYIAQIRSLHA